MNEHKEARQTRCTHESTDLCLHKKGNDLPAGKERSLQDAEEKETLEGNGRRLRNGSLNHFWSLPTCLLRLPNAYEARKYRNLDATSGERRISRSWIVHGSAHAFAG